MYFIAHSAIEQIPLLAIVFFMVLLIGPSIANLILRLLEARRG